MYDIDPTLHKVTIREGNGDNLPYPGVDYLGLGTPGMSHFFMNK